MKIKFDCLRLGFWIVGLLFVLPTFAQTKKISGKVFSEDNATALSGVSVLVKGKTTITQTNTAGEFSISVADNDVLQFKYVGYASEEVAVQGKTSLTITLKPAPSKLDEVVVIGYGTQKRKEFTGASNTLNALATRFTPSSNVGTALQGAIPGLLVQQATGAPGSTPSIVFRGGTGFDGTGSPMVVLDGVVVPSLYGIDMNDVESVDVLKDAASTAIYGARAANGVILVTTKKEKR